MRQRTFLAAIGIIVPALGLASAAHADSDHPLFRPVRDAMVVYDISSDRPAGPDGPPAKIMVAFSAVSRRFHVDFFHAGADTAPFSSLLVDPADGTQTLVIATQKAYVTQPFKDGPTLALPLRDGMKFTWTGLRQVAGTPCIDWAYSDVNGQGTVCVTSDGVLLRATRTAPVPGSMTAISVTYETPPAALFRVPSGYTRWTRVPHS